MSWAFDADVLIYAATLGHPLGEPAWRVIEEHPEDVMGSALLIPELLIKPVARRDESETAGITAVLARLALIDVTEPIAVLAVELGAAYGLRAVDATHLASAVSMGAGTFVTNNSRDFKPGRIDEIEVIFPGDL